MTALAIPKVLVPVEITDAMLSSSSVAEPAAGETAWVSGGTYAVGDRRIRVATHKTYECVAAHAGITTPPEDDPARWLDIGPTQRWAMFDASVSTPTEATGSLTVVLQPGFFNAIALYGLVGATIAVTVKDEPGGAVIFDQTSALDGPYGDWYEWLFAPYRYITKLVLSDILPFPDAELTITVTAGVGEPVAIGMVCLGDLRPLLTGDRGGTLRGGRVEPVDYSYIQTDAYGNTKIKKRPNTTGMRFSVALPPADAEYALSLAQEVLAVPTAWIATTAPGFEGMNVFGLGSGSLSYPTDGWPIFEFNVKGLV